MDHKVVLRALLPPTGALETLKACETEVDDD